MEHVAADRAVAGGDRHRVADHTMLRPTTGSLGSGAVAARRRRMAVAKSPTRAPGVTPVGHRIRLRAPDGDADLADVSPVTQ